MTPLIAHSYFHMIVFYIVFAGFFVPELVFDFRRRAAKPAMLHDHGSYRLIMIAIGGGVFLAFWFAFGMPATTLTWWQEGLFWIGLALVCAGMTLRWYAIHVLGRFFTTNVATQTNQHVVDHGPYRWVRHPSYSGAMLAFAGLGLAMTDWASLLVMVLGVAIAYGYRVRIEERALCATLGQPYRDYMRRTHRFVPFLW